LLIAALAVTAGLTTGFQHVLVEAARLLGGTAP
jgi:hypothetical protein